MKQNKHRKKGRFELSRAISSARDGARVCGSLCRGRGGAWSCRRFRQCDSGSSIFEAIIDASWRRPHLFNQGLPSSCPPPAPAREDEGLRDWSRLSVRHAHACVDVWLPCVYSCPPSLVCADRSKNTRLVSWATSSGPLRDHH